MIDFGIKDGESFKIGDEEYFYHTHKDTPGGFALAFTNCGEEHDCGGIHKVEIDLQGNVSRDRYYIGAIEAGRFIKFTDMREIKEADFDFSVIEKLCDEWADKEFHIRAIGSTVVFSSPLADRNCHRAHAVWDTKDKQRY